MQTGDNCTGDYDCPASAHIDGCFVFDKRQAGNDRDPYDAVERDLVEFIRQHRPRELSLRFDGRTYHHGPHLPRDTIYVISSDAPHRRIPLDG